MQVFVCIHYIYSCNCVCVFNVCVMDMLYVRACVVCESECVGCMFASVCVVQVCAGLCIVSTCTVLCICGTCMLYLVHAHICVFYVR